MGIPHLTAQIRPYAQSISFQIQQQEVNVPVTNHQSVVIDGPSFAYHVYHLSTSGKHDDDLALNSFPTYSELARAAIAWLNELESFGLFVKHIFFDGFLPSAKNNTRYDRLAKSLAQLTRIRSFTAKSTPGKSSDMPAAPFLVSAVCDALWSSNYGHRITTVPCEAEVFCTDSGTLEGSEIILTNDSDLLLLAEANRVMFFSSIEMYSYSQCKKTLCGEIYDPAFIREELNCTNLVKVGFMLTKHANSTLKELVKRVQKVVPAHWQHDLCYVRFCEQFSPEHQFSSFSWAYTPTNQLVNVLHHLDARVSEFVNYWGAHVGTKDYPLLGHNSNNATKDADSRHIFLPFLIDDPWRASAWRTSSSIRTLAYSLLASYGPRFRMMEVDRRGERMLGVHVPLISQPLNIEMSCKSLLGDMLRLHHKSHMSLDRWKCFSILQILSSIQEQGSELPPRSDVRNHCLSSNKFPGWNFVHFSAQIQGYLYSLRILQQILDVYLAANIKANIDGQLLIALKDELQTLPSISEVMPRPGDGLALGVSCVAVLDQGMDTIYPEIPQPTTGDYQQAKSKTKRKAKQDRKVVKKVSGARPGNIRATNMYSVLEDA